MGGFYRGIDANIMRAMVLNGTKMGVYDHCKGLITKSGYIPSGTCFPSSLYTCLFSYTADIDKFVVLWRLFYSMVWFSRFFFFIF